MIAAVTSIVLATKLAQAVATEQGSSPVKVYVGALPARAAFPAPLPKGTLLGSIARTMPGMAFGGGTLITAYFEVSRQDAADAYEKQLASAGFRESQARRVMPALDTQGGFAVQERLQPSRHRIYCNQKDSMLEVSTVQGSAQVLSVTSASGGMATAMCSFFSAFNASGSPPPSPPPLPTLNAPANVQMRAANGFGFLLSPSSDASLTTQAPVATVGAAFAQQLASAGWSGDTPAQSASAYVQMFHFMHNGRHYQAVLSIVSAGKPQRYDANLRETDLDQPENPGGFGFSF
jgi:hypothetical protein